MRAPTHALTRRAALLAAASLATTPLAAQSASGRDAIAERLRADREVLVYWPAGANFRAWLSDTLAAGFARHVRDSYGVDLHVELLATGGGDAAFWQKLAAFDATAGSAFSIDVVRVAPDLRTLDAIAQGRFAALPDDLVPRRGDLVANPAERLRLRL